jgi:hypothetical protein
VKPASMYGRDLFGIPFFINANGGSVKNDRMALLARTVVVQYTFFHPHRH